MQLGEAKSNCWKENPFNFIGYSYCDKFSVFMFISGNPLVKRIKALVSSIGLSFWFRI